MTSQVNVNVLNTADQEKVKVVAAVMIDPATGKPTSGGGGGSGGATDLTPVITAIADLQKQVKMPTYSAVTAMSVATDATGANWTAFGSQACESFDLVNDTGVAIEYRRNGAGVSISVPNGGSRLIMGITNANQIGVRRVDQTNTAVTVKGEAFKV